MKKSLIALKIKTALFNTTSVLKKPTYLILALFSSALALGLILWSLNFSLLGYVIFDSVLGVSDKISFFLSIYKGIFVSIDSITAASMIIFSVLFGINLASLTFVVKNQRNLNAVNKSTFAGLGLAIIGGGCIACGTSLLGPLLIAIGAGGSAAFLSEIGVYINFIASIFLCWSIYRLGLNIGTIRAKET